MSSIERVCIYFTLILYVGGPGEVLLLKMGIFTWEWLSGQYFSSLDPSTGEYCTIMYIYYITRYYTKISLFTLQYFTILLYNTIQCTVRIQNTLFIPGCSCCSCLLLSIWLTTVHIEFWVVSRKKNNKDCHFG